uniref:Alliinase C-terminal domain-containing protein n=1 Tax=Nelumbo nucifera TaxID=4432 RepID=A0A822YAI1_NELNU|nr:TPA_asm: hypothetical protein HUJ06_030780 [Nelumbo nucifera]
MKNDCFKRLVQGASDNQRQTGARVTKQRMEERCLVSSRSGDPKMFELYWQKMGDKCTVVISVWQSLSYFSDITNLCWFLQPELAEEIRRLHHLVASTETEGRYIVVGTGSTQLFQAVLYALSSPDSTESINIISTVPYYSVSFVGENGVTVTLEEKV